MIKKTRFLKFAIIFIVLSLAAHTATARAPYIDPAEDSKHFGDPEKVLFWTPEQQVAGYRNVHQMWPTRRVAAGPDSREMPVKLRDFDSIPISSESPSMTVDEYFVEQSVAGLLVLHDGNIVYERYGLGNKQDSVWLSFSVAKSVTSMLVGAAIRDGYIESVDEKVTDYLPRLKGSAYDEVSLKDLLQMSSGVAWNEDYADPDSDINQVDWSTLGLYEYMSGKTRAHEVGTVFNYNTAETNLIGTLLRSAIGNNLSTYLSEKIWKPFGMQADAYWALTEPGGGEFGGSSLIATLRDYALLGLFALRGGHLDDGTQVLADGWMKDSTTAAATYAGYGYQWWLSEDRNNFSASGIFGQGICIFPDENVVIALHSAREVASEDADWALQVKLCRALAAAADSE